MDQCAFEDKTSRAARNQLIGELTEALGGVFVFASPAVAFFGGKNRGAKTSRLDIPTMLTLEDMHCIARGKAGERRESSVDKASKRIVYEVVLSEDQGNFKFGQSGLPDEAKAKIDELVAQLKADPKGAYFEIEGHTDNVGDKTYNEKLGMERADAVRMYLYTKHQIPLHRINVISYGEDKPVAPKTTRAGRAQNRRVVIRVLA